jgi:hypothetical protein
MKTVEISQNKHFLLIRISKVPESIGNLRKLEELIASGFNNIRRYLIDDHLIKEILYKPYQVPLANCLD